MTQPLALVVYEKLLPGSQLVNRLQDLNYRVRTLTNADTLVSCATAEMPMLVLADLTSTHQDVSRRIRELRQNTSTAHIPVIAFGREADTAALSAALAAGAALATTETAILSHLPELLEQALRLE
jgi:PleD family two-component response regulator